MSADDLEQEQQSAEETDEVEEETTETEETESSEEVSEETEATEEEAEAPELTKARKVADDQRKRAEKAESELKKLKGGKKESGRAPNTDDQALSDQDQRIARAEERAERAELRAMGVTHPDDIEYVRGAATRLGVNPAEAVSDDLVAGKLEKMRAARKTKDATPRPSNRGGGGSGGNDVARLADKVSAGADLPSDPALAEKVQQEMARRAQQSA